jgi:hypothetical protein
MWNTVDFGHANLCKFWIVLQEQNWFFLVVCLMSLDAIILLLDQSVLVKDLDLIGIFLFRPFSSCDGFQIRCLVLCNWW